MNNESKKYHNDIESIRELIKRRRFQILVHSYIYYRLYEKIISNDKFDEWACELIELQKEYPEISSQVELADIFQDFYTIGAAAMLPLDNDPKLESKAKQLLKIHKENM